MSSSTGDARGAPAGAAPLVAAIHAALDQLGAQVLGGEVSDGELTASVEALHKVETRARAEKLRRVAEIDRRKAYASQGSRSTHDLLARRLGLTRGEARREADTATKLERLPVTARRFRQGELGSGQADTATRVLDDIAADGGNGAAAGGAAGGGGPAGAGGAAGAGEAACDGAGAGKEGAGTGAARSEAVERFDEFVAREGAEGDRGRLRRRINEWQHDRDPDWLADRDRAAHRRRRAWVRTDDDGSVRVDAQLDPLGGARVKAALDALSRPVNGADPRSSEARYADALVELADRYLAGSDDAPDATATRPQVLLIATVDGMHDRPAASPATVDGYGPVSAATAQQVACDAETTIVTVDRNGEVLDAGRARRRPSTRQRAAVIARDRQCVGCEAPVSRCEIHHVRWWTEGGPTDLDNLVLACWNCHHHIHNHNWQVICRPDGSYTIHPPQPAHDHLATARRPA